MHEIRLTEYTTMTVYGTQLPYRPTEAAQEEFYLEPPLEPDQVKDFLDGVKAGDSGVPHIPVETLLQAIDPETGDSALHVAAQMASLDTVNKIMACWRREQRMFYVWARHALFVHQNHNGDTMFHVAARSGSQDLLTMLFRYTRRHWSAERPDIQIMTGGAPENDVYPKTVNESDSAPCLLLLLTKNHLGRDPAAEARHAGHEHLAQWLDDVVTRYDPDGTRRTGAGVADMIMSVRKQYSHDEMEQRQQA